MKQLLQNLGNGEMSLAEIPVPVCGDTELRVMAEASVVSVGTEKMLVEFGKAGWIEKARKQPEKVRMVVDKVRSDGLATTYDAVKSKLDTPIPLGYSMAGRVVEVGRKVEGFKIGDRVACAGPHAEQAVVGRNLCARIPEGVSSENAAFGILSSIPLQGIRLLAPEVGERIVVVGLGLLGLLAVQILKAAGCTVLAIDFDLEKCKIAEELGAQVVRLSETPDWLAAADGFSDGRGVDGVLITASTKSSEPVHAAATACRKRGRIVLVGVTGLDLKRSDFYEKELSFQVSCSYGPGRYDPVYEEQGIDYPFGLVRWTEQRNLEAVLSLMEDGKLDCEALVSHRFNFEDALSAYGELTSGGALGVVLQHAGGAPERAGEDDSTRRVDLAPERIGADGGIVVGAIGAGNFASRTLFPAIAKSGMSDQEVRLKCVASRKGLTAVYSGNKFGFESAATGQDEIFEDSEINLILVTTRHNDHAPSVIQGIEKGKHVFVEKPLAITSGELDQIVELREERLQKNLPLPTVMVGFNRRFAPSVVKLKERLGSVSEPMTISIMVNAGELPADHWLNDRAVGGGRIIGEGCHFIDLCRFLVGCEFVSESCSISPLGDGVSSGRKGGATIQLSFKDGSQATVFYLCNGHRAIPKERIEVFVQGRVYQIDNYRSLTAVGDPELKKEKYKGADKGHRGEIVSLFRHLLDSESPPPIPWDEIEEVSRLTLNLVEENPV